jgi:hypothetical protein
MNARHSFVAGLVLLALAAAPAAAQQGTFEIVPQAGYSFGGGKDFDGGTLNGENYPGGKVNEAASFSWGVTAGYDLGQGNVLTVLYQRQDTDVSIDWNGTPPSSITDPNGSAGFANNYILFGYRKDFRKARAQKLVPYIGAGLGMNIMDVDVSGADSKTYFALTAHGGVRYMFGSGDEPSRFGLQADFRGLWTYVPSGDYYMSCWYYCYAYESSSAIAQGTVSGGVVIKF